MTCEDIRREMDRHLDAELDPESEARIREHLYDCVGCRQARIEREGLARLVRTAPYYPASDRLRARVSSAVDRRHAHDQRFNLAAAALLLLAAGAAIASLQTAAARNHAMVEAVVSAHVRSLATDRVVDVRSTDQHTVKPWFLGKLDFSPPVVDLASKGYSLLGGRIDNLDGSDVAALVYQRGRHPITVFVSSVVRNTMVRPDVRSVRGFNLHHWINDGLSFWVVSDVNDAELSAFVRALQGS